jgi:hypothetical protein
MDSRIWLGLHSLVEGDRLKSTSAAGRHAPLDPARPWHYSLATPFLAGADVSTGEPGQTWQVFDANTPVLTCSYGVGPAVSNALAVGVRGGIAVISPPYRASETVFGDLRKYGPVRALVASNAFHHMGIPEWKARFPDAKVYAPAQSLDRVRKKTRIEDVRPLAETAAIAGDRVEFTDMPYYRTGEALVRIHAAPGLAWYVTDIILNLRELPRNPVLKLLFKMTGSAPGLRFNKIGPKLMVRDGRSLKAWLEKEYERTRPRWLIATHGVTVDLEAERESVRQLFR